MAASATYVEEAGQWTQRYQRNNKQNGLKNLRCFPFCSSPHRLSGFCGHAISVRLSPSDQGRLVDAFAEFTLRDEHLVVEGQRIAQEEIQRKERHAGDDLFKPWYRGELSEGGDSVTFNKQKKGWHYSWMSNKHTSDSEHVFRVYLLEKDGSPTSPLGSTEFRCFKVVDSPAFTIFCRRRNKSGVPDLPPQFRAQGESPVDMVTSQSTGVGRGSDMKKRDNSKSTSALHNITSSGKRGKVSEPSSSTSIVPNQHEFSKTSSSSSSTLLTPTLEGRYSMVMRVLAALNNIHESDISSRNQQQKGNGSSSDSMTPQANISSTPISMSSTSSPAVHTPPSQVLGVPTGEEEDDIFDFSKAISDCWDWLAESQDDNNFLGGLDLIDSFLPQSKSIEELLMRLGDYLVREDFTQAIEALFSHSRSMTVDESKEQVLETLKDKFEAFFHREGTTLDAIDHQLCLENSHLAGNEQDQARWLTFSSLPKIENMVTEIDMSQSAIPPDGRLQIVPGGPFDFSGHWKRDEQTLQNLEKIRSVLGFNWLERKLMLQMETEFFIWHEGDAMYIRSQRKLSQSNIQTHIIDGKDHPLKHNNPGAGLFTRSFATLDGTLVFCVTYSVKHRTVRRTKRSEGDGNKLESIITLQTNEQNGFPGKWTDVHSFNVSACRVTKV